MRAWKLLLVGLVTCVLPIHVRAAESAKIPLNVLYLGRQKEEQRSDAFVTFLSSKFQKCTAAKRNDFQESMLAGIDVVVIDWSQQERLSKDYESPVGKLENWKTPTILLGSAGLLIAGPWSVIGGAG